MRTALKVLLVLPAAALFGRGAGFAEAAPPAEEAPAVVLKSGQVLSGKVAENVTVQGTPMYRVETEFGEVLVPRAAVARKEDGAPAPKDATFLPRQVRVVQVSGDVQRRPTAEAPWEKVALTDPYAKEPKLNAPNALVAPGDTLRTGADGQIDLMLHKSVWVRVSPNSEVEIPRQRGEASLSLLKGDVLQKVDGRPRGEVYRVRTPTTLLGVRGTLFAVHAREGERVRVAEGSVALGTSAHVDAGQEGLRGADGSWTLSTMEAASRAELAVPSARFPLDRMALVPAATYSFGGDGEVDMRPENEPWPDAVPCNMSWTVEFKLAVDAFLMDRTEVTHATLTAWRQATGTPAPPSPPGVLPAPPPQDPSAPLAALSWNEARALARWLGKDLPSDAQWEAAARGPEGRIWPWGNKLGKPHLALPLYLVPSHAVWSPGHSLPPSTEEPTVDVTPLGIQGLCSDPPEWTRSLMVDEVFWPYRREPDLTPPGPYLGTLCIRGTMGTTRTRFNNRPETAGAGVRCVVELAPGR